MDVTGCGNAFCGGFLAALYRGAAEAQRTTAPAAAGAGGDSSSGNGGAGAVASSEERAPAWLARADLAGAAAWGCVAASFMAEARGVPLTPISQLQVGGGLGWLGVLVLGRRRVHVPGFCSCIGIKVACACA